MKFLSLLILSVTIATCSATKNQALTQEPVAAQEPDIPSCINEKIESFKKEPKQNPPVSITEYTYNGKKVYYIPGRCCDQYSELWDSNCNLLGHPDGGITGKGDGKFPGFGSAATKEKLIWKDER